jgi:glyoxylase-like metal-dependent hydrolase (beta-lactamase superfamily II)
LTHRLNLILLLLGLLVLAPFTWFLIENPSRDLPLQPLTLARLRQLADGIPGDRPVAIEVHQLGDKRVYGNIYVAGSGMKRRSFSVLAFRLVMPAGGDVVIDTGTSARIAAAMQLTSLNPAGQAEVDQWMAQARAVVATSELPQHLGGLSHLAGRFGTVPRQALLNPAQVPSATARLDWPASASPPAALDGTRPRAIAPGVVVIPTGAPTPGSQMIYARLAGGREYIFAGDVAPFHLGLAELRVRSNLLDRHRSQASRRETMRWLLTLRAWQRGNPGLVIVPGHDFEGLFDPQLDMGIPLPTAANAGHNPAGK